MRLLSTPLARLSSCSNGHNLRLAWRLTTLRRIANNASAARTAARKHVAVQPGKSTQPKGAALPARKTTGAFRPELFRYLKQETPTILVQSPSPIAYRVGMYMLAGGCFAYSIINYFTVLYDPPAELPTFAKGAFTSINIAMACLGAFCVYKTTRIVSSVSALPYIVNKTTGQKGLMLQIEKFRTIPIPGRSRQVVNIPANEVFTNAELGVPGLYKSSPLPPTRDEKMAERIFMRQKRRRDHQENISRLWTLPFREVGHFIGRAFVGLRDAMHGDGWVYLRAKGHNGTWRIGRNFDWALDNGHAFDKVIKIDKL